MMGYAKYALIGLGSLIFLFFAAQLRRREREAFDGPAHLAARARRLLARWRRSPPAAMSRPTEVKRLRSPVNVAQRQVEELVERDPDRVAQQVRAWMSED